MSEILMWENEKSFWQAVFCKWFVHMSSRTWENKIFTLTTLNGRNNSFFRPNWRKIDKIARNCLKMGLKRVETASFTSYWWKRWRGMCSTYKIGKNTHSGSSRGLFRPKIDQNMRVLNYLGHYVWTKQAFLKHFFTKTLHNIWQGRHWTFFAP